MNRYSYALKLLLAISLIGFLSACKTPNPSVEMPPPIGITWMTPLTIPLASLGYEQQEYFFSGTANAYTNLQPLTTDGQWSVVKSGETADYKSRMVVFRPIDPADFNGTVVIEWMNVSSGLDTPSEWIMTHTELIRQGYAFVGVSAQYAGIEGGDIPLESPVPFCLALKCFAPLRYASLSHPGDSFSYDIFQQAAQAVRYPQDINPLGSLQPVRMIATGQSQSAHRLITFINAFGPTTNLFDGYFVHSRIGPVADLGGSASAPLAEAPQALILPPTEVKMRTDLRAKIMNLQTETDQLPLGALSSRQADSKRFRLWEVAGTAHADLYVSGFGLADPGNDVTAAEVEFTDVMNPLLGSCPDNVSSAPQHHFVTKAAFRALHEWIVNKVSPPKFPRLSVNAAGDGFELDAAGNALGGVRSPYVDAPIASMSGLNSAAFSGNGLCFLFGTTNPLPETVIDSLYSNQADYIAAVTSATYEAVAKGAILEEDAELIIAAAEAAEFPPQ